MSLHAPNDETRSTHYAGQPEPSPVEELFAACRRYLDTATGRRISFEYAMIGGVNDSNGKRKGAIEAALKGPALPLST